MCQQAPLCQRFVLLPVTPGCITLYVVLKHSCQQHSLPALSTIDFTWRWYPSLPHSVVTRIFLLADAADIHLHSEPDGGYYSCTHPGLPDAGAVNFRPSSVGSVRDIFSQIGRHVNAPNRVLFIQSQPDNCTSLSHLLIPHARDACARPCSLLHEISGPFLKRVSFPVACATGAFVEEHRQIQMVCAFNVIESWIQINN